MQQPDSDPATIGAAAERHILDRLKRLGISAWHEPLLCLPKSFLDYSQVSTLKQALPTSDVLAAPQLFSLQVTEPAVIVSQPKKRLILNATDGTLLVKIVVFIVAGVDVPTWKDLAVGQRFHVRGVLQNWNGSLQMVGPTIIDPALIGTTVPVYEKRRGVVADGAIYDATRHALKHHLNESIKHLIDSFHGMSETDILRRARLKAPSLQER